MKMANNRFFLHFQCIFHIYKKPSTQKLEQNIMQGCMLFVSVQFMVETNVFEKIFYLYSTYGARTVEFKF